MNSNNISHKQINTSSQENKSLSELMRLAEKAGYVIREAEKREQANEIRVITR